MSLFHLMGISQRQSLQRFAVNRVRFSYLSALLILVILCGFNYSVLQSMTASQSDAIALMDMSGRQRMLAQRVALLTTLLFNAQGNERDEYRANVLSAIEEMRTAHDYLQRHSVPEMQALYAGASHPLNGLFEDYLMTATRASQTGHNRDLRNVVATLPLLLRALDDVTHRHTVLMQNDIHRLQTIELFLFLMTIVVMFLVGVGIFLPMERRIQAEIEERKYIEQALQENQQFLHQILNMTPDLVYVFDVDEQRHVFSNRDLGEALGYTSEQFEAIDGHLVKNVMHPDDFQRVIVDNRGFFARNGKEAALENEYRLKAADGTWRWFYSHDMLFASHADGSTKQVIGTAHDITERKLVAMELQEREERFRLLVTHSPVAISQTDADGRAIFFNPRWAEMSGIPVDEALGTGWVKALHPDDRDKVLELWYATSQAGHEFNREYRLQRRDGEVVWVASHASPIRDADGEVTGYLGTVMDITVRKLAEQRREESEEKFRQLAENLEHVFWLADTATHKPIYLNPAYDKVWGIPRERVMNEPSALIDLVHPDDRERMINAQLELAAKGGFDVEFRITRPDGAQRWLWSRGFPVKNDEGVPYRFVGVTEDITERKEAEQQRVELGLEREKIQVLAEFIADTSHDLRTPLTVITTSVYLLNKGIEDKRQKERLAMIDKQVAHIDHLIEELQNMVKIDRLTSYELAAVDVNKLFEVLLSTVTPWATAKNINLSVNLDERPATIAAELHYFQQALKHIFDNAVHYTPADGTITVNTRVEDQSVIIEIQDTGIGIMADDLPYVFDRYYKADKARTLRKESGMGVGLTIAKKIIEGHGGTITAESVVDQGSLFRVTMPLAAETLAVS